MTARPVGFCTTCRSVITGPHNCQPRVFPCTKCGEMLPPGMGGLCVKCADGSLFALKTCKTCGRPRTEPRGNCTNWMQHRCG